MIGEMTVLSSMTTIKIIGMDVNLVHHGYNVERRKMYPSNRNSFLTQLAIISSLLLI